MSREWAHPPRTTGAVLTLSCPPGGCQPVLSGPRRACSPKLSSPARPHRGAPDGGHARREANQLPHRVRLAWPLTGAVPGARRYGAQQPALCHGRPARFGERGKEDARQWPTRAWMTDDVLDGAAFGILHPQGGGFPRTAQQTCPSIAAGPPPLGYRGIGGPAQAGISHGRKCLLPLVEVRGS